jgi:hypothetical protein
MSGPRALAALFALATIVGGCGSSSSPGAVDAAAGDAASDAKYEGTPNDATSPIDAEMDGGAVDSPSSGEAGGACTSDSQCPPGLKCCYPCGVAGCSNVCMEPTEAGRCPMFP